MKTERTSSSLAIVIVLLAALCGACRSKSYSRAIESVDYRAIDRGLPPIEACHCGNSAPRCKDSKDGPCPPRAEAARPCPTALAGTDTKKEKRVAHDLALGFLGAMTIGGLILMALNVSTSSARKRIVAPWRVAVGLAVTGATSMYVFDIGGGLSQTIVTVVAMIFAWGFLSWWHAERGGARQYFEATQDTIKAARAGLEHVIWTEPIAARLEAFQAWVAANMSVLDGGSTDCVQFDKALAALRAAREIVVNAELSSAEVRERVREHLALLDEAASLDYRHRTLPGRVRRAPVEGAPIGAGAPNEPARRDPETEADAKQDPAKDAGGDGGGKAAPAVDQALVHAVGPV